MEESINEFIAEFERFQAEFQDRARAELQKIFQRFWELNPGINAVIWQQYAPHFNDGEPCVFSVCDPTFTNCSDEDDLNNFGWGEYDGENEDVWAKWSFRHSDKVPEGVCAKSCEALSRALCSEAFEDTMVAMFGPDSEVIATRAGFRVDDYSSCHD